MILLGRKLRRIRNRLNESQAKFGDRHFGVNQSTIARWETEGPKSPLARKAVEAFVERRATLLQPLKAAARKKAA